MRVYGGLKILILFSRSEFKFYSFASLFRKTLCSPIDYEIHIFISPPCNVVYISMTIKKGKFFYYLSPFSFHDGMLYYYNIQYALLLHRNISPKMFCSTKNYFWKYRREINLKKSNCHSIFLKRGIYFPIYSYCNFSH
jgi:hypothetical protein